ncbi:hypothetical protein NHP190002_01280 [Helicobacter ailurogastricus]|uniref:hypothetical protein n=1 Tax=Helicobacter ailurogastricus TaxID=1578720 RepID=UPI00244D9658|nr:hypothetical protein [Helicobacter ailurogastricus]GMB89451.1 hypothetical protein NHP190002_01280 [Helicobacter ailurogastricus]
MGIFDFVKGFMESTQASQDTPQMIEIDEEIAKHVRGSGDSVASDFGYTSWIAYYKEIRYPEKDKEERKNKVLPCCQFGCPNNADRGAHVKIEGYGERWWIVPVCPSDNPRTNEPFNVKANTIAVRHPKK